MRIGMVTLGRNVPSTRFRMQAMVPYLEQQGHELRVWTSWPSVYEHFPSLGWRASTLIKRLNRWRQYWAARRFRPDCIYLERGVYHEPNWQMDLRFRQLTPRLVLDVDDGIFLEFPQKIPQLIAISDHVVTATPTISQYVAQHCNCWTEIPTSVSLARYAGVSGTSATAAKDKAGKVTVGWIGTAPNVALLAVCAAALRQLASELEFRLLVVANSSEHLSQLDLSGVEVQFQAWDPQREVEQVRQMDIGIMPLPEDREFMRYKAATKLIQYLACGLPAVASPIGVNADILAGEQVGLAASTTEQWLISLRRLITAPELRMAMGRRGRQLVAERFSVEANAPRLERLLTGRSTNASESTDPRSIR